MFSVISITLLVIVGIIGFILTVLSKKRMEKGLGRKVDKLEANSISNWMEVSDNEEKRSDEKRENLSLLPISIRTETR